VAKSMTSPRCRSLTKIISLALIMVGALTATVLAPKPVLASSYVPSQYITKIYTEALGRAPEWSGFNWVSSEFLQKG
jgi:hypothetical protein